MYIPLTDTVLSGESRPSHVGQSIVNKEKLQADRF